MPLATHALPGDHLVVVLVTGHQRVVELPVVLEGVTAARRGDAIGIIDAERPAADIHFMGAVVERFAGAPDAEPVPVVGLDVVLVGLARRRALPQIPVERGRHGNRLAVADGFPRIVIPALGEVGAADQARVDLVDDLDGVRGRALLGAHLHQLAVFLLRFDQQRALAGIVAAGFFNVDVLPGLKSEDGHRRMPVIGRGDGDGVDILALENLAKVLLALRRRSPSIWLVLAANLARMLLSTSQT